VSIAYRWSRGVAIKYLFGLDVRREPGLFGGEVGIGLGDSRNVSIARPFVGRLRYERVEGVRRRGDDLMTLLATSKGTHVSHGTRGAGATA
jgi:hypothetical protein